MVTMPDLDVLPAAALVEAVYVAARELDIWHVYVAGGRYHFALGSGLSVALCADSADRICVESCRLGRAGSRMWCLAHQHGRLAGLVRLMSTMSVAS